MKLFLMMLVVVMLSLTMVVATTTETSAVTVCVEDGIVTVGWDAVPDPGDLAGYNVYRSVDGGIEYTKINAELIKPTVDENGVPLPLTFTDLVMPSGEYYAQYTVTSVDTCGNGSDRSPPSDQIRYDTIPPAVPGKPSVVVAPSG